MTRPKVDPDKRQRTAQACESCKRRKQKCNGLCPCNTCGKRNLNCSYGPSEHSQDESSSPTKRRLTDNDVSASSSSSIAAAQAPSGPPGPADSPGAPSPRRPPLQSPRAFRQLPSPWGCSREANAGGDSLRSANDFRSGPGSPMKARPSRPPSGPVLPPVGNMQDQLPLPSHDTLQNDQREPAFDGGQSSHSGQNGQNGQAGQEEEAVVYSSTRMLQDPTGRLLYIGDSATLSYLQLIRMIVDLVAGPSPFTTDPRRHRIMEASLTLPPGHRQTHLLPDRQTADILVRSFFTNTHGILEVFNQAAFFMKLQACYSDPLTTDPSWLCLLNLVFAIGLIMATPAHGTPSQIVITKLRNETLDRAELFYLNAKSLNDPTTGFEDADFWSVQALLLMTVYMLAVSKRNAAYAYFGMAVRSAFALGLHREETLVIYSPEEKQIRKTVWRSLFVFDRFLSASMGRPTAISEEDCSGDTLRPSDEAPDPLAAPYAEINSVGLEASVRSCHTIGVILRRVYVQRRISTRLAQEIADACKLWPKALSPMLHWRQASSASPNQGIAILHVNILYCHSIILLTRPFFLYLLNYEIQSVQKGTGQRPHRLGSKMEKFSEACVIASTHTVVLVQNAREAGYLQQRNPFVIYFLFAAALIILSNEFSNLYVSPSATLCIADSISIMTYCAETDPQAQRLLFILTTFRDVVAGRQDQQRPRLVSQVDDPMDAFFSAAPPAPIKLDRGVFSAADISSAAPAPAEPASGPIPSGLTIVAHPLTGSSDGASAADEAIDFDTLWQWSSVAAATSAAPAFEAGVQGISDSAVPLFGMRDPD